MSESCNCNCGKSKVLIIVVLIIAVIGVVIAKKKNQTEAKPEKTGAVAETVAPVNNTETEAAPSAEKIPLLIDLGAGKCIPCKMMEPILEELREEYAGKLKVKFIDVWQNKSEGVKYNIRMIPTQIFMSPDGSELFRHEGFYSKDDILGKWKELGFSFDVQPVEKEEEK